MRKHKHEAILDDLNQTKVGFRFMKEAHDRLLEKHQQLTTALEQTKRERDYLVSISQLSLEALTVIASARIIPEDSKIIRDLKSIADKFNQIES